MSIPRFQQLLAQAERFAATDTANEAVARAELVEREVRQALTHTNDAEERERLEAYLVFVESRLSYFRTAEAARQARIRSRQQHLYDREMAVMKKPLPPVI